MRDWSFDRRVSNIACDYHLTPNPPAAVQSSLTDAQRLLQQQGLDTNAVAGASRRATQEASGLFDQVHAQACNVSRTCSERHVSAGH